MPEPGKPIIDLRSDTVTKPSPEMRRAMAEAEVGDDVYLEDPTVNRLQERAAEIFGREAALFVPSGSMGNQICIKLHTHHGSEVICEERGHIYNFEMATMAAFSGVLARPIPTEDGVLTWVQVERQIRPKIYYRAQTALISLENTHNLAGGTVYPPAVADEICDRAHERGIPVHLDGARIFNAAVALRKPVQEITRKFDSIQFCLSKGLGAPIGSLMVGSREFIERARVLRKTLGGGMRQVGVLAAPGLIALEQGPLRLEEDHRNARYLAEGLARIPGVKIDPARFPTNILVFDVSGTGMTAQEICRRLAEQGVLANAFSAEIIRMVTHLDVNRAMIERALEIFEHVVLGKAVAV
jgi:threonine aldolase